MTPFDPAALLAMLLAFYPVCSPAALVQAMRERPEYFASAVAIGHSGDAIQLPDGRVFDLIFSVDDPGRRHWQVVEPNGAAASADPFPLEDGPLRPIDPAMVAFPLPRESFVDLVAGALVDVAGHQTRIDTGYTTIAEHSTPTRLQASSALDLEPAAAAHGVHLARFDGADPADVIATTASHAGIINTNDHNYDDPLPAEHPVPDPGDRPGPGDGDTGRV